VGSANATTVLYRLPPPKKITSSQVFYEISSSRFSRDKLSRELKL